MRKTARDLSPGSCALGLQQACYVIEHDYASSARYMGQACSAQQQNLICAIAQSIHLALPFFLFPGVKRLENTGFKKPQSRLARDALFDGGTFELRKWNSQNFDSTEIGGSQA